MELKQGLAAIVQVQVVKKKHNIRSVPINMYKYKKYTHSETLVGEKGPPEHNIWSDGNSGFITFGG